MRRRMAPATVLSLAASTAVLCSRTRAQASLSFWVGCCGWAMEKEEGRAPRVSVVISSGQGERREADALRATRRAGEDTVVEARAQESRSRQHAGPAAT